MKYNFNLQGNDSLCLNENIQCRNGGYCKIRKGMPTCICSPGFFGVRCQFDDKLKVNLTGINKS